jgi:FMN-dependent NADH-azoreductase
VKNTTSTDEEGFQLAHADTCHDLIVISKEHQDVGHEESARSEPRTLDGEEGRCLNSFAVTTKAIFTKGQTEAESLKEVLRLSDQLTEEVLSSDLLVIASPMWNFGLPSSLKAWVDHIVRPGKTFRYVGDGVEGRALGKKAILVLASGGVFSDGRWKSWDTVEPYLRLILGFIGITDVQTVRTEGMNIPALAPYAVPAGERAIETLAI